jgi:hypothetical protein
MGFGLRKEVKRFNSERAFQSGAPEGEKPSWARQFGGSRLTAGSEHSCRFSWLRLRPCRVGALPAGFIGDQGFQSQSAEKNADRRAHLDEPASHVKTGATQREPGQQRQRRIASEREWQAFVHESPLWHAGSQIIIADNMKMPR